MKLFVGVLLWCVVFAVCPLCAVATLVLFPVVWVLALPFRLIGLCVGALFDLLRAVLFLPARLLGWRPTC